MNMMNDLFGENLDQFILIFLDDILIYSANVYEHYEHWRKVLDKLQEHCLCAKANKCDIVKISVEFLSQQIQQSGMTPMEAKLKAVQDWGTPNNVWGVRSFLGLQIITGGWSRILLLLQIFWLPWRERKWPSNGALINGKSFNGWKVHYALH